jgi:hypothetical protein
MAAGKDEPQSVVRQMHRVGIDFGFMVRFEVLGFIDQRIFMSAPCLLAAYLIDDLALCDRRDPGRRIVRHSFRSPVDQGGSEGLLHRLFGQIKGTRQANQSGGDLAGLLPENRFGDRLHIGHSVSLPAPLPYQLLRRLQHRGWEVQGVRGSRYSPLCRHMRWESWPRS